MVTVHDGVGKLSKGERARLLHAFDQLVATIPRRPLPAVKLELATVRQARRARGRQTPADAQR